MTDREKRLLSRQLTDQANLLEGQDGGELSASLALACCEMLKAARRVEPDDAFEEVYFAYLQVSEEVESFFAGAEAKLRREEDPGECAQVQEQLKAARARCEEVRTVRSRTEEAIAELQERTDRERGKLEAAQEELAQLNETHRTVLDMMEDCSQDKIREQKQKNDELIGAYQQRREILGELEAEQREQEEKNREIIRKINALENIIAQMPERGKELVRTYQELDAQLDLLRRAETECSPERQAEMQAEIDRMEPVTEQMRRDMETLGQCLEELRGQYTKYDAQRHTLATNVLELWTKAVADLRTAAEEHETAIAEIDASAQLLVQRLADCEAMRQRYGDWLDAGMTPLQAMMDAVGRPECEALRATLDPGSIERVRRLSQQIEGDLKDLDGILSQCSSAVRMDQRALERRARR